MDLNCSKLLIWSKIKVKIQANLAFDTIKMLVKEQRQKE